MKQYGIYRIQSLTFILLLKGKTKYKIIIKGTARYTPVKPSFSVPAITNNRHIGISKYLIQVFMKTLYPK